MRKNEQRVKIRDYGSDFVLVRDTGTEVLCSYKVYTEVDLPADAENVELVFSAHARADNFKIQEKDWGFRLEDVGTTLFHEYFERAMRRHYRAGRKYVHIEYEDS